MVRPVISVILPVYNGALYLKEAVESILTQDFSELELIVIDDASTDDSSKILERYKDNRIIRIKNNVNIGLASTLNLGIAEAKGRFVARMDQDDIADASRLASQLRSFVKNPELGLCGTNFQAFGSARFDSNYPLSHDKIFTDLLFYNCLAHPSVMFRKSLFVENNLYYDKDYDWAEDFELWARARHAIQMLNLKPSFLKYRINASSMTASGESKVHRTIDLVNKRSLSEIGIDTTPELLRLHFKIGHHLIDTEDYREVEESSRHLFNLYLQNQCQRVYQEKNLRNTMSAFWNPLLLKMSEDFREMFWNTELSKLLNSRQVIQWQLRKGYFKQQLKKLIRRN